MAEERSLTDAELDAALADAFAVAPSGDFVARVRTRLAGEETPARRLLPIFAVTVTLAAVAIVVVVAMLGQRPEVALPRVREVSAEGRAVTPGAAVVGIALPDRRAVAKARSPAEQPLPARLIERRAASGETEVLISAAEQQALRRLLERPPTAVLRFAPTAEPTDVAAIAIAPLNIDPLSPQVEEGGHQ